MVSRIVTIGLLAFLVIALVGGSAYILLRPNEAIAARNAAGQNGAGQNGARQNRVETAAGQQGYGFQGGERDQGQAGGGQGKNGSTGGEGVGQGRRGGGEVLGEGAADHPVESWLTLSGRVAELTSDELTLETDAGLVTMHLGPEWYWESEGIDLSEGNEVDVTGFYEGDAFEIAEIKNLDTGETATLRDETGRPRWAGRGRGGQGSAAGG
ncbi:MAG: hypothetical protein PVI07_12145 [Anaerolineae bacterium]|jgi:hypothetical protein